MLTPPYIQRQETSSPGRPPRVRNLIVFSTVIMLLFGMIVLYQAFREYDLSIGKGKANAERLTAILSDQVELSFLAMDLTLQRAVERQYLNMLFGGHLPEDMVHNFNVWVENTPQLVALMLVNEKGEVELAVHDEEYEGWMDYSTSMADTEAFKIMKNNDDQEIYIGPYFDMPKQNMPSAPILMARRINKLDGTFGGIVVAAVYGEYFLNFFDSVDSGLKRYMSLMLTDGRDLFAGMRHHRANDAISQAIHEQIASGQRPVTPVTTLTEQMKGTLVLVSYRYLKNLPLVVAVVIEEEDFLAEFWQERFKDLSFLAIFTVFGSVLSFFALTMARQIIRVEESEAAAILASQAKSEFLANMSHELRTPLNAIIGFSEMMTSGYFGPMNARQKERLNDINLCGNHLLHLINDILEFSKGEAGKLELVEERSNIAAIVDEVIRMMGDKIKTKNINMTVDTSQNLPLLFADMRKIKQVLINLVSNAIKFTPQGGDIKVSVRIDPGGAMNLVVSDSGIGIAEEDIQTALSVFGQVHRSKSHEGTGLGLPLCRMYAELHGGKLSLVSALGEGTTVRVVFPANRVIPNEEKADGLPEAKQA